jgi:hypothetical protein
MGELDRTNRAQPPAPARPEPTAFSNGIRLTGLQWLGVGLFTALLIVCAPLLWSRMEVLSLEPDDRMPHDLGNDYWLYERRAALAVQRCDTVLLGDSVIWGEYVTRQQTLSHYLNELAGEERYANLGLDGAHPLALGGLVRYYARSVSGKKVVLHCNPLWLTSSRRDLSDDKATDFNHPRLVPQFVPRLPSYQEEVSPRLGVVVEQHLPFSGWTNHLQQAYYDRTAIPDWTLEHPYDNPVRPLTHGLPPVEDSLRHLPEPWYRSGITKQDFPWVDMETSLQWHAFQRVVDVLRRRENRVFVLVGPFNEHLLTPESRQRYQAVKTTMAAWLEAQQVPHLVPPPLPSEQYGDASHPLAEGYAALARQLREVSSFPSGRQ